MNLSILAPVCDVNLKLWDGVVVRERCGWYGDFTHVVSAEKDFYQKPPKFFEFVVAELRKKEMT